MAIIPENEYPAQIDSTDSNYPHGKAQNVSTPGDGTGTPLEEKWVNDHFGFQQALLDAGGVTPSGTPDEVGTSDYLDAMIAVIQSEIAAGIAHLQPVTPYAVGWVNSGSTPVVGYNLFGLTGCGHSGAGIVVTISTSFVSTDKMIPHVTIRGVAPDYELTLSTNVINNTQFQIFCYDHTNSQVYDLTTGADIDFNILVLGDPT